MRAFVAASARLAAATVAQFALAQAAAEKRLRAALGMLLKGLERGVRRASAAHDTMRRASAALPPDAAAIAAAAADN